ncbi:MAG: hypothetical protein M1823_007396, partial [Watsoniomyces obsoletus]
AQAGQRDRPDEDAAPFEAHGRERLEPLRPPLGRLRPVRATAAERPEDGGPGPGDPFVHRPEGALDARSGQVETPRRAALLVEPQIPPRLQAARPLDDRCGRDLDGALRER